MTSEVVWRLLDIEATTDSKVIRRAYAAKLRAIDPDEDREGFSALRDARDRALALAAGGEQDTDDVLPVERTAGGIEVMISCPPLPLAAPAFQPAKEGSGDFIVLPTNLAEDWQLPLLLPNFWQAGGVDDAINLGLPHWAPQEMAVRAEPGSVPADHALHALLNPSPGTEANDWPLNPAEVAEAMAIINHLHDEARLGAIDLYDRTESWLAHVLASAWPRSQPLLYRAAQLFGWTARDGQIGVPPAIEYINRRLGSDRFAEAVQQKQHPLNSAWRQLSKPTRAGQSRAIWWQGAKIDELLATIRRDYPEVEDRLDWHRVAMWEAHRARPIRWWTIAIGIVFGLQLLFRVSTAVYHPTSEPVSTTTEQPVLMPPLAETPRVPGGLGDVDADMKAALLGALGPDVTPDMLKKRAPLVLQLFESNWRLGLDAGRTRTQYVEMMTGVIRNRYMLLARQAGGEHLIALQRQRLREERQLKGEHWHECAEISQNGGLADPTLLSPDMHVATQGKITDLILAMPANPERPGPGETFPIPGQIVQRTVETSGLTLDQVSAAFQGNGTDREKCLTHIALLDAALNADAEIRSRLITHL